VAGASLPAPGERWPAVSSRKRKLEPTPGAAHHKIVRVRAAAHDDVDFVRDLAGEVFAPFGDYRQLLPKWLKTPGVMTFVAESDGERAGYVMIAFFRESCWLVGDILAIAVAPKYQGLGVGRSLMQHAVSLCEQEAARSPVRAMRLSVADTNERAQRLFLSFGFVNLEGDFGQYDGGQQALHMERPIDPHPR